MNQPGKDDEREVPLEAQTQESLIALIHSLESQAERDEKRRAAEREWIRVVRSLLPDHGIFSGMQNMQGDASMTWQRIGWKRIQKVTANLDALAPAPPADKVST